MKQTRSLSEITWYPKLPGFTLYQEFPNKDVLQSLQTYFNGNKQCKFFIVYQRTHLGISSISKVIPLLKTGPESHELTNIWIRGWIVLSSWRS